MCTVDEAGDGLSMWYILVLFGMEVLLFVACWESSSCSGGASQPETRSSETFALRANNAETPEYQPRSFVKLRFSISSIIT